MRLPVAVGCAVLSVACCGEAAAQHELGTVKTPSAKVTGAISVSGRKVVIQNRATVAAGRETAKVKLARGGEVRVCLGSTVALSQAVATNSFRNRPLLLALQRGGVEIAASFEHDDGIITPDLRIESSDNAPVDLRMRVNESGDTCVENDGKNAPILHVTEQFSGAGYLVKPGQHVVFQHGSVRAVVNRVTTQCGCPRRGKGDDFPEAESAGFVPPTIPQAPAGQRHVQVAAGMDYDGKTGKVSGPANPDGSPAVTTAGGSPEPGTKPRSGRSHNPFRAIGHFFRRLFGRG